MGETMKSKTAILIIDVQNDFCANGALPVSRGDEVIAPINEIVEFAMKNSLPVIASRDWHPPNTKHFQHWPSHCVQNSEGAKFHSDLKLGDNVTIISKGMDSEKDAYSAFDGFTDQNQSLDDFLLQFKIKLLIVCGLATDYCVKATVLDAARKCFKVILLKDACRAVNLKESDGQRAIEEMRQAGVIINTTTDVINEALK